METTSVMKSDITKSFEEIRLKLNKKEKEILEKADSILQDHMQEFNTYSRILQSKIISLNKLIDSISSNVMRKDEITLLNFYSENKNKIMNNSEIYEIPNIPDFNTIHNMKVTINSGTFDNLINAMNALHLEITSMKGFDISTVQGNQRFVTRRNMYGMGPIGQSNSENNKFNYGNNSNTSFDSKSNMKVKHVFNF